MNKKSISLGKLKNEKKQRMQVSSFIVNRTRGVALFWCH